MSQIILPYDKEFFDEYQVYIKPVNYSLSNRKIESLINIANMQRYFHCNPVKFIEIMFGIELLDFQALMVERSWLCPNVLCACTRGAGKTTVMALLLMAKGMLNTNHWSYIASGTGDQAQQSFGVLEKLANDNIETFQGSTGKIFKNEVEIKNAAGDGFSHSASGFHYDLYSGSSCSTLNSNLDSQRGRRGTVWFDETAWLSDEMLNIYGAFAIVDKNLKTGKDASGHSIDPIRQRTFPTEVPNQKFYVSSASSTDMPFYKIYRDFAKRQIAGDPDYCVLHIDCEQAFHPTLHGEVIAPLLQRSQVESELRRNPDKARREFFVQFTTSGGANSIIRRGTITRNEEVRKPLLHNDTGNKKFIITYDPARLRDNSVVLISELYDDALNNQTPDLKARLVNCITLADVNQKNKTPMQIPEQVDYLRKIILAYDGGTENYENIVGIWIDGGSGGAGGTAIADLLMQDWETPDGVIHRGLIDKEYSSDYVGKFPNAVDKLHIMSPSAYKSLMYESLIEMVNQDKVKFTAPYDNKGVLTIFDIDEDYLKEERIRIEERLKKKNLSKELYEVKVQEELEKVQSVNTKVVVLDYEDELALANIDALKEELVNVVRKKREGSKDSFDLSPEKANKMHKQIVPMRHNK